MKTKKMQWLAVLLAVVLLCSGVPLLTAGAAEDSVATAQKAVFQLSEGTLCNAHPEVTADHWRVDIYFDKTLTQEFPANSSYWNRHLQASTLQDAICSNIRLNGKTLTECLELEAGTVHDGEEKARNIYNAYHVQTVGSNGEVLRIAIPVDNLYGISDTEDFTLQITDGITLNGAALSVATVQYCASTKELTVANASAADAVAHVTGLQLENHERDTCSCGFDGAQWSMVFWTDQPVEPAVNKSFYGRHLTVKAASSTDGMSLVGVALRKRILINGKNLDECISLNGNGEYKALHVQAGQQSSGAKKSFIRISIPKDNQYGFDGQNFEITFLDGIILNGYALAPQKIVYPEKTVPITYDGAGASAPAADGSSALRFKFTLTCAGVSYADATHADGNYQRNPLDGSSKVTASGKEYTLVDFGAIVSNKTGDNLTLGSVDKKWILQVPARNLYDVGDGTVTYTARVMGVPSNRFDRILYARAYATVSDGESTWTLYGETVESCIQALLSVSPTE